MEKTPAKKEKSAKKRILKTFGGLLRQVFDLSYLCIFDATVHTYIYMNLANSNA